MEKREQFLIQTSFPEACHYLQNVFFPKAKEIGIGAWIQLLSPGIIINETKRFSMRKVLERRMFLTILVEEDINGKVCVTVLSTYRAIWEIVGASTGTIATCGLVALVAVPLLWVKYQRWKRNFEKSVALLKSDLVVK